MIVMGWFCKTMQVLRCRPSQPAAASGLDTEYLQPLGVCLADNYWGFSKLMVPFLGGPNDEECSVLGSILGFLRF